jgi:CRISPR-associated protein Csd1
MILTRLAELYDRLASEGTVERAGYEYRPIAYLLVLDSAGKLLDIIDTREPSGAARHGRSFSVPAAAKRTVGIAANLLWDNVEYSLGLSRDTDATDAELKKVAARHNAFRTFIDTLFGTANTDEGIIAVQAFLVSHQPVAFAGTPFATRLDDRSRNVAFVLNADPGRLICEREAVRARVAGNVAAGPAVQCLITGQWEPPARLHPALRGVAGGQTSGVSLVSFNLPAFQSYGLAQGDNAPVGTSAAFAYGTALNWLLAERRHRLRLGQLTVVFWAAKATQAETFLSDLFGDPPRDEAEAERSARAARVQTLLTAPRSGIVPEDMETGFYLLGLAPNAARAAVASWHEGNLADAVLRVRRWFDDLALAGRPTFIPETLSLPFLLRAVAPLGEMDRLSPRTPAALLSAALDGGKLPEELLTLALGRLRVSRRPGDGYALTALLRVALLRNHAMETTVSLDLAATDPAYRWGRLFAVFEKAQEDAQEGINVTVRDRFWASAAATPSMVFGVLSRLNGHHLRKLETPGRIRFERLIGEIMSGIQDFPSRLSLPEQGRFALGYWHQRTALFTRRDSAAPSTDQAA